MSVKKKSFSSTILCVNGLCLDLSLMRKQIDKIFLKRFSQTKLSINLVLNNT